MAQIKATAEQMQSVVIGGNYAYTNKSNFTNRMHVTRVTESSVFYRHVDECGKVWGDESREGWKNFSKFALVKSMMSAVYAHRLENNVFTFYVQMGEKYHNVKIVQYTDFTGTILADDFPNGSTSTFRTTAPLSCKTERDCVNFAAPKLLKEWTNI